MTRFEKKQGQWYAIKIRTMMERMTRAVGGKIPNYYIQYAGPHKLTGDHIFALRMPITDAWEPMHVSEQFLQQQCVPKAALEKLEYWVDMFELITHARDWEPMNKDLTPITPEERAVFGVRPFHPESGWFQLDEKKAKKWKKELYY